MLTVLPLFIIRTLRFSGINRPGNTLIWLAAIFMNTLATELLLRGYLFRLYRKYYGFAPVAVIITFLFLSMNPGIFKGGVIYAANMLLGNFVLCLLDHTIPVRGRRRASKASQINRLGTIPVGGENWTIVAVWIEILVPSP